MRQPSGVSVDQLLRETGQQHGRRGRSLHESALDFNDESHSIEEWTTEFVRRLEQGEDIDAGY